MRYWNLEKGTTSHDPTTENHLLKSLVNEALLNLREQEWIAREKALLTELQYYKDRDAAMKLAPSSSDAAEIPTRTSSA